MPLAQLRCEMVAGHDDSTSKTDAQSTPQCLLVQGPRPYNPELAVMPWHQWSSTMVAPPGGTDAVSHALQGQSFRDAADSEFRQLLAKLPVPAYTCDADGLITFFNEPALQLWGREPKLHDPADRFCGCFRLFSPDGSPLPHHECWMALAIRDAKAYNEQEIFIERPDGGRRTVLAYASPVF